MKYEEIREMKYEEKREMKSGPGKWVGDVSKVAGWHNFNTPLLLLVHVFSIGGSGDG